MKRVMIIGNCGAGKSTLARKIHGLTQLHLIHLDQQFWQPGWVETDLEIWREKVKTLLSAPEWIIDGNYGSSMVERIERADTIILLETSVWKSAIRVIKRVIKYRGRTRPDMPEGCDERFSWSFLHYVLIYNFTRKPANHRRINEHGQEKTLHILKNEKEINAFLKSLRHAKTD